MIVLLFLKIVFMEQRINLVELLKDCPHGMELDCTMYNQVYLQKVCEDEDETFPIVVSREDGCCVTLTKYGQYADSNLAKCVIFPKGKTTWEGFKPPYKFKDGDIVSTYSGRYIYILKGEATEEGNGYKGKVYFGYCTDTTNKTINSNVPWHFSRLATEEEKQKLFDAIKANGYKWNDETKTLERLVEPKFKVGNRVKSKVNKYEYTIGDIRKDGYTMYDATGKFDYHVPFHDEDIFDLVPSKFDITTLKPFESRVLVRDTDTEKWKSNFWGFYDIDAINYPYECCCGIPFAQCIPYEGNEHLLSKTDDCDDFYKTWE